MNAKHNHTVGIFNPNIIYPALIKNTMKGFKKNKKQTENPPDIKQMLSSLALMDSFKHLGDLQVLKLPLERNPFISWGDGNILIITRGNEFFKIKQLKGLSI